MEGDLPKSRFLTVHRFGRSLLEMPVFFDLEAQLAACCGYFMSFLAPDRRGHAAVFEDRRKRILSAIVRPFPRQAFD
jgi:hypothetical protein